MKTGRIVSLLIVFTASFLSAADRRDLRLPQLQEYIILPCDLHTHTVFSDGEVWPTLRVREAWQDGLAVLAITDHIEYQPHGKDMVLNNFNRSFEIALPMAERYGLLLIKAAEITRAMPPGHLNALFLENINLLNVKDWRAAVKAAAAQGAFIFWNHPGWTGQQPDGVARWYEEHSELLAAGMLHGIEVVNEDEYYPQAHRWCLEKNLTMLGNSDIHSITAEQYNRPPAVHRPMTWVLATADNAAVVKEALFARRTVIYWRDQLIGTAEYLEPIFKASLQIERPLKLSSADSSPLKIVNQTDLTFELIDGRCTASLQIPKTLTIPAASTVIVTIQKIDKQSPPTEAKLSYTVANLKIEPEKGLPIEWTVKIE